MFLLWGCTIIHVPLLYLLRASQEYPKHSPNPEFLARLKKTHLQQVSILPPKLLALAKIHPLGAEEYTHPRRTDPARGSVPCASAPSRKKDSRSDFCRNSETVRAEIIQQWSTSSPCRLFHWGASYALSSRARASASSREGTR